MTTYHVTGKTNDEATESFRDVLKKAVDGDTIELSYGIECQGPFLIWSKIEIIGQDPGAHTIYAPTSPVLNIGVSGVTIRQIAVHYTGPDDGVALQSVASNKPTLDNVDILGQVVFRSNLMRGGEARPQPVTHTQLNFGTVERPDNTPQLDLTIHNEGDKSWHYNVNHEAWLKISPAEGTLHPDAKQTLQVSLNNQIKTLPVDRWLDYPTGVTLSGDDIQLDVPVRIYYLPPPPKLSRIVRQGKATVQMDTTPVIFPASSNWNQPPQSRTILSESDTVWKASVVAPNWLSVFPTSLTIFPREKATLSIRPRPSMTPPPHKSYQGIIILRDGSDETVAMLSASFEYRPDSTNG